MFTTTQATIADTIREHFRDYNVAKIPYSATVVGGPDDGRKLDSPFYGLYLPNRDYECIKHAPQSGYVAHNTEHVIGLAHAASDAFNDDCRVRCYWRNGHIVEVAPSNDYRRSIYGTDDNVFPRLWINAGYDGSAFSGQLGWYRDACSNLAMLQSAGNAAICKIRHTDTFEERYEKIVRQFSVVVGGWDQAVERMRDMENRQVQLADFIRNVYPQPENPSNSQATRYENRVEDIINRVIKDRRATGRPELSFVGSTADVFVSGWEAYNAVQGYAQHAKSRHNSPDSNQRAILALHDPEVATAERLALGA